MTSDQAKIDSSYKALSQREYTSPEKKWHEEFAGKAISISASDIWMSEIPDIPPATSSDTIELIELILTEDVSVSDSKSWYCCSIPGDLSTRIGDFIQPSRTRSQAYFIRVYDNTGRQIYVGDAVNWEFNYVNGILTFENPPAAYEAPFHIRAYRYIGKVLESGSFPRTLNDSYIGGSTISVDSGPVIFNASSGSPAIQISPVNYVPTEHLADGQIINNAGILYVYDSTRSRWISMMRQTAVFGCKKADGRYLSIGGVASTGFPCLRHGVIVGITAQGSSGYDAKRFSLINGTETILEFNLYNYIYINNSLNLPFDSGDVLKVLASSEFTPCNNVTISLEIAWRV